MTLSAGFKLAIIEAYYENGHSLIAVKRSLMSESSQWGAVAQNLFFLCGYLNSRVYRSPYPKRVEELKKSIKRECGKITKDMIVSAVENFNARMQYVISKKGAWFEQIMNS